MIILLVPFLFLWELGVFNLGEKPAVYLYPEKDMDVNVSVEASGLIVKSIPDYNGGWSVHAEKDGLIDGKYPYLYYEVLLFRVDKPKTGWVV